MCDFQLHAPREASMDLPRWLSQGGVTYYDTSVRTDELGTHREALTAPQPSIVPL